MLRNQQLLTREAKKVSAFPSVECVPKTRSARLEMSAQWNPHGPSAKPHRPCPPSCGGGSGRGGNSTPSQHLRALPPIERLCRALHHQQESPLAESALNQKPHFWQRKLFFCKSLFGHQTPNLVCFFFPLLVQNFSAMIGTEVLEEVASVGWSFRPNP